MRIEHNINTALIVSARPGARALAAALAAALLGLMLGATSVPLPPNRAS